VASQEFRKVNFVATRMPNRTEITKVTSDAKTWHGSGHTQSPEAHLNSGHLLAHFDRVNFVQRVSFTHTFDSILVSIETV